MATKVEIKITRERIEDVVTVDEMIELQEGSMKAAREVMGRFVLDNLGTNYVEEEEGKKIIGKMTIGQLKNLLAEFQGNMESSVVPSQSSAASG